MPKTNLIIVLFLAIFLNCCSKHNEPSPTSPVPKDTLGIGWQAITVDTAALNLSDVFFVNNQTGFVCGNKYLGKSTDGGLSWKRILPDSLNEDFTNLFFVDANTGWVTGQRFLLRTMDGGDHWTKVYSGATFDVQFFDSNNGYVTKGSATGFYRTTDGGLTLQRISAEGSIGLFFFNQNSGWFSGAYLYKTTNAGSTVVPGVAAFDPHSTFPYAIQFTDTLHGWIAGSGGVFRTLDGGKTLETLLPATQGGDIQFFDNNAGYILADNKIFSTTDGGKTLTLLCSMHKIQSLIELHFTDINHGWATGLGSIVYRFVKQ